MLQIHVISEGRRGDFVVGFGHTTINRSGVNIVSTMTIPNEVNIKTKYNIQHDINNNSIMKPHQTQQQNDKIVWKKVIIIYKL